MYDSNNLYNVLKDCVNHNETALVEIFEMFEPLINKYTRFLNYEDAKSDLIEKFYICIFKIPVNNPKFKDKKYILAYISKSMKNAYIKLNQKKNKHSNTFYLTDDLDLVEDKNTAIIEKILVEEFLDNLKPYEKAIFIQRFVLNKSESELAQQYSKSRQAINKSLNKLKKQMRNYLC